MLLKGIWDNDIYYDLIQSSDINEKLYNILEIIDISHCNNTEYLIDYDTIMNKKIDDIYFPDWLYDSKDYELFDLKKELNIKLEKGKRILASEYEQYIKLMKEYILGAVLYDKLFLLSMEEKTNLTVYDNDSYFNIIDFYLEKIDKRNEFISDFQEYFPNIYFDDTVIPSLNTLNNTFPDLKKEIIEHLRCLNNFHSNFVDLRNKKYNNKMMSEEFKKYSGIDCSPQSNRKTTKKLKKTYLNKITNKKENICCELHTKFSKYNRNNTKQDRIYFHPGREGIYSGKIIVIHIGTHL